MTFLEIILLLTTLTVIAGVFGYVFSKGKAPKEDLTNVQPYTVNELANIKAAEEAAFKSIVGIDQQIINKITNLSKKLPEDASINLEEFIPKVSGIAELPVVEAPVHKSEFPIDKPKPKKKYPRKKKPVKVQE